MGQSSSNIVDLDDQKLTRIPSYIYSIFSIQNLYLQANQITSISGRISNLINLEELYLGGNKLTKIPEEIGTLTKLRELSLSCNNLQSIPSCVGNLTNLRQLYLDNNKLTSLPDSFSQLTQLETFYVNNNELTSISESLSTLVNLHDFYIFGNQITTLPDGIVQLPKLTDLKLQLLAPLAPESSADPKLIPDAPSSSSVPTEIFEASNTTICESPTRVSPEQIQDSTTIQQLQSSKLQCIQGQLAQALKQLDQQRHNHEIALQEMARQHELEISNMHREHQKTLEDQSRSYSEKEEVLTKKLHRIEDDFQQAMEHVLSHVQEEKWVHHPTAQPLSSFSKFTISVNDSPVSIHETSFAENICCFCPLDKVVKMLVHNHCGVSEQCQEVMLSNGKSLSGTVSNLFELEEEEDSARRAPGTFRATHGAVSWLSATVRILPEVKDIYESDLQIVEIIGSGHNGSVAKCHYVPENRQVSVKRSHDHTRKFDRKLFKTQATVTNSLRHPNIVKCIGFCEGPSTFTIISEYFPCSLRHLLSVQKLTTMQVACLSTGISKGMAALHLQNICHYSLTSSNILLDRGGNPKVSDWGAQPRDDAPAKPVTAYMPPQMLSGNYSRKGDLWEFAVLVCEMILGSVPSVEPLKDTTQTSAFIENQLRQMSPSSRKETNKLLGMPSFTSSMMATCLGRREACLKVTEGCLVGSFPIFTPLITRCLSISESERPEFYIAERLLSVTLSEALYPEEFTTDAINLCLSALGSSITTLAYSAANSE